MICRCPMCGEIHDRVLTDNYTQYSYTGRLAVPWINCLNCVNTHYKEDKPYRDRRHKGLEQRRGLSVEENKRRSIPLELEGRRLRREFAERGLTV